MPPTLTDKDFQNAPAILHDSDFSGSSQNSPNQDQFNQTQTGLGFSQQLLDGIQKYAVNPITDIGHGVGKGVLSTVTGVGTLASKGLSNLPGEAGKFFAGGAQEGQNMLANSPMLNPQNVGESIGYGGEKVGEFFIPAGAEKEIMAKGAQYIDKLPEVLGLGTKGAYYLTGALKTALQSAITGGSMAGVTAAQTGGDIEKTETAGKVGLVAGGFAGAIQNFGQGLLQALNKADFRLSPQAEAKAVKKTNDAAQFITENNIMGTNATKYAKLNSLTNDLENTLQASLPSKIVVPKETIINNLMPNIESLKTSDPAIYNQALSKANEATNLLPNELSLQDTLAGKRSYGTLAFKTTRAAVKDPLVSSEGAYAIEQAYQKSLEDKLGNINGTIDIPKKLSNFFGGANQVSLPEFNKVYSSAISAKQLSYLAQFKNDTGLFGRLFGLWVGKSIGETISPGLGGQIAGGALGELASSHLPGAARNISERVLNNPQMITGIAKTGQGIANTQ